MNTITKWETEEGFNKGDIMDHITLSNLITHNTYLRLDRVALLKTNCDTDALLIFMELVSEYQYYLTNGLIKENEWFFSTMENIEKQTGMSEYRQRKAILRLKNQYKLISMKIMGLPARRHFKVDINRYVTLFASPLKEEDIKEIQNVEAKEPEKKKDVKKTEIKEKKEIFYTTINNAIQEGLESFKKARDQIDKTTAIFIFAWSRMIRDVWDMQFNWDSESFGIMRHWVKKRVKTEPIDYASIKKFIDNNRFDLNTIKYIKYFIEWEKNEFENPMDKRITDPLALLKDGGK